MSIIYSAICILFLSSIMVTAVSRVAPPDVYSAIIHNTQDSSIQCNIIWLTPKSDTLESGLFTIGQNDQYHIKEKTISMGSWEGRGIIQELQCGELVLKAPFDGVNSPKTNWEFFVYPNEIVSGESYSHTHQF